MRASRTGSPAIQSAAAWLTATLFAACSAAPAAQGVPAKSDPPGPSATPPGSTASIPSPPGDTSPATPEAPSPAAAALGSWTTLGTGVSYRHIGEGAGIFLAYGGYTAQGAYSQAWAEELWQAKLQALGVGHLYAMKGPDDAEYEAKEIATSSLAAHLKGSAVANAIAASAPFILIGAHSSGAFVANELLGQLTDADERATLGKIVYACLDGGGTGLDVDIVSSLRRIAFVSAKDPSLSSGTSENASAEMDLGEQYAEYGGWLEVSIAESGCHDDAHWCLHDLLVTHKPHDPDTYDLKDDYTDFAGRPPTVEWIDMLSGYLTP